MSVTRPFLRCRDWVNLGWANGARKKLLLDVERRIADCLDLITRPLLAQYDGAATIRERETGPAAVR
jgi:hypothetical protein